jgi:hypothetical protein
MDRTMCRGAGGDMLSIGVLWEGGERGCCAANDGVVASAEVFKYTVFYSSTGVLDWLIGGAA